VSRGQGSGVRDQGSEKIMGQIIFQNSKILFAGNKIAMHEDCCCTKCDSACAYCTTGYGPQEWQVVIAGIVDGFCGDCDALGGLNGTYVLSFKQAACEWRYVMPGAPCGYGLLSVNIRLNGVLEVWFWDYNRMLEFEKDFGDSVPCCDLVDEDIPYVGDATGHCDGSSATCTLTALV